jgi:cytochrome c-type biogenesis protein CcmH
MIGFLIGSALLGVTAIALLTRPLWRATWRQRRAPSLKALAKQSEQLAALHRSGALDDEGLARARALVEARVMETVASPADGAKATQPVPNGLIAGIVLFVGLVVVGGYATIGSPGSIDRAPGDVASGEGAAPHGVSSEQMDAMVDRLAQRLKADGGDANGWTILARSYVAIGRHRDAVTAFERAVALRPDDAALWADYADALAMATDRKLEGRPLELVDRALALDPDQPKALALAGTAAFDHGDYRRAAEMWERLVRSDADGQLAQQMKPGLDEARRLAGLPPLGPLAAMGGSAASAVPLAPTRSAAAVPDGPAPPGGGAIEGRVILAPELAAAASPDDTVFVYARPQDGRRMPLSILRKQVRDLPLVFVLDDSHSMSPEAKLSSARIVTVEARVSKSGSAMPQPGDLVGSASDVAVGTRNLAIRIDHRKSP